MKAVWCGGFLCLALNAWPAVAEPVERLGLVVPLTGPISHHGRAIVDGLGLGLEAGGCRDSVEVSVEDDGYDPKRSVTAARRLISEKNVTALLSVGSGPSNAIAPLTDKANIPFLALAADPRIASSHQTALRLRPSAAYEGGMVAQLAEAEDAKSVALICTTNDFTLAVCDAIARKLGAKVSIREDVLPEEADFKTLITKIRTANVSHVIPILMPGKVGLFARQLRELKIEVPLIGGAYFESSSDVENSNGALIGGKYIMADVSPSFRKLYNALPDASPGAIAWSAAFFDAGQLICRSKRSGILAHLKTVANFEGAAGTISYQEENGDKFLFYPFTEKEITKDGFVKLTR